MSNTLTEVQKQLGRTTLCAPKVLKEVNFLKNSSAVVYRMDCRCAPILLLFSVASNGARTQRQFFNRVFGKCFTSLRKDSVASYAGICTVFPVFVIGADVLCNALNSSQIRL